MPIETQIMLCVTTYKIASLFVGATLSYMGYRLFVSGIWGDAGTFSAKHADNKLVLKNAAPGTFFAMFGAIVVVVTLFKGLEFRRHVNEVKVPNEPVGVEGVEDERKLPDQLPFR